MTPITGLTARSSELNELVSFMGLNPAVRRYEFNQERAEWIENLSDPFGVNKPIQPVRPDAFLLVLGFKILWFKLL